MWLNNHYTKRVLNDASSLHTRRRTPMVVDQEVAVSFCSVFFTPIDKHLDTLRNNLKRITQDDSSSEIIILTSNENVERLTGLCKEYPNLLKVYIYPSGMDFRQLRNQCVHHAIGQVMFFLEPEDQLSYRPTSYIFNQMNRSKQEEVLILEKPFRTIQRFGFWRNTFYEIGGFDEKVKYAIQGTQLVCRLNKYGITSLKVKIDHYTTSDKKRAFLFLKPSISQIRVPICPTLKLEKLSL